MNGLKFVSLGYQDYFSVLTQQIHMRAQRQIGKIEDTILIVEHPRVITQGSRPVDSDFRIPKKKLQRQGFEIHKVKRGGGLTYHGPGQMVSYFIFSLISRKLKVPQFVHLVEETAIQTLKKFGITADRREDYPGVWIDQRKIVSIGLSVDQGVSMHGMAVNVTTDLKDFEAIVPCGISDCKMTSMQEELQREFPLEEVEKTFKQVAQEIFSKN